MNAFPLVLGPVEPATTADDRREIRKAAEAFEALLLQHLIRRMRAAQLENGFFGESAGSSTYDAMFEQHLSEQLADGAGLGIADILEAQWTGQHREAEAREAFRKIQRIRDESLLDSLEGRSPQVPGTPADKNVEGSRMSPGKRGKP